MLDCFPLQGCGGGGRGGDQERSCSHCQEVFALQTTPLPQSPGCSSKPGEGKAGACSSGPGCVQGYACRANNPGAAKAMETTGHLRAATPINTFPPSFDSFHAQLETITDATISSDTCLGESSRFCSFLVLVQNQGWRQKEQCD